MREEQTNTDERLREEQTNADERLREEQTNADERLREEQTNADERLREEQTKTDERLREEQTKTDERLREEPMGLTHPALKEWSAAVHALLDGRQTVLLRKGGIGEKRFEVAAQRFLFFPTVAHSHAERVRPEHRDLLAPAASDSDANHVVLRAGAKVVAAIAVSNTGGLADIEPLHIWTEKSVRKDRLDFRPRHRLTVLVVQACPLVEPVRLARTPDYAGCTSWVDVPMLPDWGTPVYDDAALRGVADRVRQAVG